MELTEPTGGDCQVGFEETLEFEERLVVESDVVEVLGLEAGLGQAVGDCLVRELVIVLAAGEPFLLGRSDEFAIDKQDGCRIVVEGRYPGNGRQLSEGNCVR